MDKVEVLRAKLGELRKELERVTMEKGLAAEDNKDLRENFAFDYWYQQEELMLGRIRSLMHEIKSLAKVKDKPQVKKKKQVEKPVTRISELSPKKWL